jgi:hypothetical protein
MRLSALGRTALLLLLLLWSAASNAQYLGTIEEGSSGTIVMDVTDAAGLPAIPDQVTWWLYSSPRGTSTTLVYDGGSQTPAASEVLLSLPPAATAILSHETGSKARRVAIIRVKLGSYYKSFQPTLDVDDVVGFHVENGVLVPDS